MGSRPTVAAILVLMVMSTSCGSVRHTSSARAGATQSGSDGRRASGPGTRSAQLASPKLPAFVEDNNGEALLPAIPPPYLPVSKSSAIAAAETSVPVPAGAYVTAGFYAAKVSRDAFWVVVYHHENIPIAPLPPPMPQRGVWHTSYVLVDILTGQVTETID